MNQYTSNHKPAKAASSAAESVSMKKWIVGAIDTLRLRSNGNTFNRDVNNEVICSREYLSCALKIAHSLANQLSAVEEERGYRELIPSPQNLDGDDPSLSPLMDTISKPWSEYISVYCMTKVMDEKKEEISENNISNGGGTSIHELYDFEPIPININGGGDNSEQPGDLQNLANQLSTLLDNDIVVPTINYLNVRGAILNEGAVAGRPLSDNGKLEINSLGLAFYELFSGGQITGAEGMSQQFSAPFITSSPSFSAPLTTSMPSFSRQSSEEVCASTGGVGSIDITGGPSKRRSHDNGILDNSYHKMMVRTPSSLISVEPLKMLGVPTALCDLISYMLESRSGGGHDESYEFISEVRDDLKLIIESPDAYLRDIDLVQAANAGLQFGTTLHGRETELQALKACYQRSISNEYEVAMICGVSGIGKSKLSEEFIRYANESGSIVLSGRCDKLQSQPLHAISSLFDRYCATLSMKDHSMAEKVATALKENLGDDVASLVTAIPNLANLFGDDFKPKENENDTAMDAQKRLQYLFCEFVAVVSSCHEEHLVLFLDDCQWIDNASVALLNQIMMRLGSHPNSQGFFFGSYRDDEMNEMHPLNLMLSSVNSLCGIKTTKINLTPMSKGALNEMLSSTLSLLPRITRPLANILHHKTKGSPLFVKQVMMELCNQRLLYPSLSRRRWVWEADKILDIKIPENVATFITKSFDRLPPEVISALVVLSCFGASANVSMIEVLEREIQLPLISPLNDAVGQSVLGKRNGEFYFMHDKLQEAAYSMMQPEERCIHHNRYGLALGFVAVREGDDRLLLSAVGQINRGGPQAVIDCEQAVVVANLNLDAGRKAVNMSDFFSAYSFFNHGISFLPSGHWDNNYDLSLELFNWAVKCALMNADHDSFNVLTSQIMHYAKCFEDRCQAISYTITLLGWSGNVPDAIELLNSTLTSLGQGLPTKITPTVIKHDLDSTKALLASLSDDTLLTYPVMENPSMILALELLSKYYNFLNFVGDRAAMLIIPLKVIQLSLTYGMSPISPVGFALYGNFLALVRNEFQEGYRYSKLALSLMKKLPSRAQDGNVMFHSNITRIYVEPMQSAIELYPDALKAALKSGVPHASCVFTYTYVNLSFWSGKGLKAVVPTMKETLKATKYHKNLNILRMMLPSLRLALRLIGEESSMPQQDQDSLINASDRTSKSDITGKHASYFHSLYFIKLTEALIFRVLDDAIDASNDYFSVDKGYHFSLTNFNMIFRRFYSGLASFWIGREIKDRKKAKKWLTRGAEIKDEMEKLTASASEWNFQNKAYLLQAEEQFCRMNFEPAEKLYDAAILSSKIHKFVNEEALANELAGHFYLETGRKNQSVHYFSQAFEKYNEWGAVAKANTLTSYLDGS